MGAPARPPGPRRSAHPGGAGAPLEAPGSSPAYLTFGALGRLGLPHATTTRHCPGVSAWAEPRAPLGPEAAAALAPAGLDLRRLAWARQVHGADVARVEAPGFAGAADVLVTTTPGLALAVFTADCLAVVLYAPDRPALAVAHVGWRGMVRGAPQAAVAALAAAGADPATVHAAIGPGIGPCCYEVDGPVTDAFAAAYPGMWEAWAGPGRAGHAMLDLRAGAAALLARAGVPGDRIEDLGLCTGCRPDLLFSYRRGHRGRLVTVAALPGPGRP